MSVWREVNILLILILGNVCDIHTIVAHSFEVTYGIQDFGYNKLITGCESVPIDPYYVG